MGKHNNEIIKKLNDNQPVIAAMPAILLCASTFIILLLDYFIPAMKDAQYLVYPIAIRIVGLISILFAGICLMIDINNGAFHPDASDFFFLIFSIFIVISTFVNGLDSQALFGVKYRYIGVFDLLIYLSVYMYCAGRIESEKWKKRILIGIILLADVIALAFIYSEFFITIPAFEDKMDYAGMFFHGNHYGYFLSIAVVIAAGYFILGKGNKATTGGLSLALNLIVMLINRTRGSILGTGIAITLLIIWLIIKERGKLKKALCLASSFLLSIALAIILSSSFREEISEMTAEMILILSGTNDIFAGNGRWGIWQFVIDWVKQRPIWGYGNEGIADALYDLAETASPHNEPLTYAAFFGIPAAVAYVIGVALRIVSTLKTGYDDKACIIAAFAATAYFISSLFGVAMFYTVPFLFTMLGLSHREKYCERNVL